MKYFIRNNIFFLRYKFILFITRTLYLLLLYLLLTELKKLRTVDIFNSYSLYVGEPMK